MFAVCVLMLLSNFGVIGIAGSAISSVLFGFFGVMAYILPFLLFGVVAFGISNKGNTHAYIKIAACVALLFAICAFFQLVMHPFDAKESLWSYYQYASDYRKAGGLTGGCLVKILCPFIGVVGAYVVLVVLMVICVILITERSLLAPLGKGSKKAYADMKRRQGEASARRAKNREKNEDRQKKQRQNRMILPEEVIIKYRVFLLQQRCRPRKVKCQRRQQRKSVKRILQEKIRICGN